MPRPRTPPAVKPAGGGLRLSFYAGPAWAPWDPVTAMTHGAGGSEIMLVEMTTRLAARGHAVTVYADVPAAMMYGQVEWRRYVRAHVRDEDVFVSWRRPEAESAGAVPTVLVAQDAHYASGSLAGFDEVWTLSPWHDQHLRAHHPEARATWQTRNGVDLARFDRHPAPPRVHHRAIYTSSPERGLLTAAWSWPHVRAAIPDAELHVYTAVNEHRATRDRAYARAAHEAMRVAEGTAGVIMHGRAGQRELVDALRSSHVWYYPTDFYETFCVAAAEAQVAGCRIVTTHRGALATVTPGTCPPASGPGIWAGRLVDALIRARDKPNNGDVNRFCLDALAGVWETRLRYLTHGTR